MTFVFDSRTTNRIYKKLRSSVPVARTELIYSNHFELLIAVMLTAQTTDKSVNAATSKLFKVAGTPKKLSNIGEEKLKTYIKTIGLYNAKAKNVIKTSKTILEKHNNKVPNKIFKKKCFLDDLGDNSRLLNKSQIKYMQKIFLDFEKSKFFKTQIWSLHSAKIFLDYNIIAGIYMVLKGVSRVGPSPTDLSLYGTSYTIYSIVTINIKCCGRRKQMFG